MGCRPWCVCHPILWNYPLIGHVQHKGCIHLLGHCNLGGWHACVLVPGLYVQPWRPWGRSIPGTVPYVCKSKYTLLLYCHVLTSVLSTGTHRYPIWLKCCGLEECEMWWTALAPLPWWNIWPHNRFPREQCQGSVCCAAPYSFTLLISHL
jgi:hypothetical protein